MGLAGADTGIRRELYQLMTEVYRGRNALPAWIAELEHTAGESIERLELLGQLQDDAGNTQAAINVYRRVLAARPGDIDRRARIAQLYRQMGMRSEEIAEYRRLVQLAPHQPNFLKDLAEILINDGKVDEAWRLLAQASARAGDDTTMHEVIAQIYAQHGKQQEALREVQLVVRFDPDSPVALTELGQQYWELGQHDQALAIWKRIFEMSRDRARGAVELARVYEDHAMQREAIQMYREAVALKPDQADFHRRLALALESDNQLDASVTEWRKVIELASRERDSVSVAREHIVNIWQMQHRLDAQLPTLEAAFAQNPPDMEAGRDLAQVFIKLKRQDDAERILRRVSELDPADTVTLIALERVLRARGELEGAIAVLKKLTQADPRRSREWYDLMARHALALHHDTEAIEYATNAIQLNDQDAMAHLRLAELYRARNDMGHAIAALRRALELNDRLFSSYFELADLYLGFRNEPREAIQLYLRVVAIAPSDDDVNHAGRLAVQIAPAAGLSADVERVLTSASAAQPTRKVFRKLLVNYYDTMARPLINRVQQGSGEEAAAARTELSRMGMRALAPMLDALGDGDPVQQRIALDILGYLGNPNASNALITVAEGQHDVDVRRRALLAAGALGDPRVLPRLITLQQTGDDSIATIATWSIAHIRSVAATSALLRSSDPSQSTSVRLMAVLGLSGTRDPRARTTLRTLFSNDADLSVRAAAAYALGNGIDRNAREGLVGALRASDPKLQQAAAIALGVGGEAQTVVPHLCDLLFAPEPSLRRASARALAQLAGVQTASSRVYDDPSVAAGGGARMLAAVLDPPDLEIHGGPALVRYKAEIAAAATRALRGFPVRVTAALASLTHDNALSPLADETDVRKTPGAREALTEIVGVVIPTLQSLVDHQDINVRRGVLSILQNVHSAEAASLLVRMLEDRDESVASGAIGALASYEHNAEVAQAVAGKLGRETPWSIRASAATALGVMGDPSTMSRLVDAMQSDTYEYVRVAAARALRTHRDEPSVRAALESTASRDSAQAVRQAARAVLSQ